MALKKHSALDRFRTLIKEEIREVIREEMPALIAEAVRKQGILLEKKEAKGQIQEAVMPKRPIIPGTLNTKPYIPAKQFQQSQSPILKNDPISRLLSETANSMADQDVVAFSSGVDGADPMSFMQNIDAPVGNVDDMLASSRPSSAIEMVQVNTVPDFTELMGKLRSKGVI